MAVFETDSLSATELFYIQKKCKNCFCWNGFSVSESCWSKKKLKESHGSRILYGLKLSVRGRITIGKHWNAEREVDCLIYRVVVFEQMVVSALCNFLNPCQFVEHQSILKVSFQRATSSFLQLKISAPLITVWCGLASCIRHHL